METNLSAIGTARKHSLRNLIRKKIDRKQAELLELEARTDILEQDIAIQKAVLAELQELDLSDAD